MFVKVGMHIASNVSAMSLFVMRPSGSYSDLADATKLAIALCYMFPIVARSCQTCVVVRTWLATFSGTVSIKQMNTSWIDASMQMCACMAVCMQASMYLHTRSVG